MKVTFGIFLIFFSCAVFGQGIRGTIYGPGSQPMPFASIYVTELNDGASSNNQGRYEIKLAPGKYTIQFQFIGYEKHQITVEVKDEWISHDVFLTEQLIVLKEIEIKGKREDPAYSIMRKAIAKRKFHLLQYDAYEVKVYMKGTGQLSKAPFFLKKQIEKEGVQFNEAYTSESVSVFKFEQPDKIEETVISIRTSGDDNSGSASPALFINQSFYNDFIAEAVSPLSGSAFSYYKFRYEGSFKEGDYKINKIRVTPRSRGEQVFEGYIYIIEDYWAIHSLDLRTSIYGFKIHAVQNYAEVAPKVWMPVTHQYKFNGNVLGFAGEYSYLASCSDYRITLNEELKQSFTLLDEKIEEVPKEIKIQRPIANKEEIVEALEGQDKITRKQFRKMMMQYEKESLKEKTEPEVISERKHSVDSLATKRDAGYWDEIRPVPLTGKEMRGYRRDDSLAQVNNPVSANVKRDTTEIEKAENSNKNRRFKPQEIVLGRDYRIAPRLHLTYEPLLFQTYYNTVEGVNINPSAVISYKYGNKGNALLINPVIRYGFASNDLYYKVNVSNDFKKLGPNNSIFIEGGRFVEQFNENEPIHPHINTLSSLLFRRNFMKLYEKFYGQVGYQYTPSLKLSITGNLEWARRNELFEQTDYSFFYREPREFTSNQPGNIEVESTGFPEHEALIFKFGLTFRPGIFYKVNNGNKAPDFSKSPVFSFKYHKGIENLLSSDVNFDQVELGVAHGFKIGIRGKLEFELASGTFWNRDKMYFMDFNHFDGNRTILSSLKPAGSFRLLDYYNFSTSGSYFTGHTHYQFRKLLLTQLPRFKFSGLRENVFLNYLKTSYSPHYYEVGYGIDNVFRIFRIEVAGSFINADFQDVGLRIGIATLLNFSMN